MDVAYGVARPREQPARVVARIGRTVVDLGKLHATGALDTLGLPAGVFAQPSLNAFMGGGAGVWHTTYERLSSFDVPADAVLDAAAGSVDLLLPIHVADYVDFYASEYHASNMGRILRPDSPALPPAWRHLPIGYHGRAATIVVSGSDIPRPRGILGGDQAPRYAPSERLDVEVELGFIVGVGNERGHPIAPAAATEHVFGAVLVNDWSARDIQAFEYQPLGPFLGKSFATSISPWVIPLDALSTSWVVGPEQEPRPLEHLACDEPRALDLELELVLNGTTVSRTNARHLYWSMAQQLAHLTSNGAVASTGDLFASGTISGPEPEGGAFGSLMELSWGGSRPIPLDDGTTRTFLEDGDVVAIRGRAGGVDFGEVVGQVVS